MKPPAKLAIAIATMGAAVATSLFPQAPAHAATGEWGFFVTDPESVTPGPQQEEYVVFPCTSFPTPSCTISAGDEFLMEFTNGAQLTDPVGSTPVHLEAHGFPMNFSAGTCTVETTTLLRCVVTSDQADLYGVEIRGGLNWIAPSAAPGTVVATSRFNFPTDDPADDSRQYVLSESDWGWSDPDYPVLAGTNQRLTTIPCLDGHTCSLDETFSFQAELRNGATITDPVGTVSPMTAYVADAHVQIGTCVVVSTTLYTCDTTSAATNQINIDVSLNWTVPPNAPLDAPMAIFTINPGTSFPGEDLTNNTRTMMTAAEVPLVDAKVTAVGGGAALLIVGLWLVLRRARRDRGAAMAVPVA